ETGFYESLFIALRNIMNEIFQEVNNKSNVFEDIIDEENDYYYTANQEYYDQSMKSQALKDNKALLSTEIIQLFCIVPSFYDFLNNSEGLIEILNLSIGDSRMYLAVEALLEDAKQQNKTKIQICEELGSFITNLLKLNARQLINKKTKAKNVKVQKIFHQVPREPTCESLDVHGTTAQIQNTVHIGRSSIRSASTTRSVASAPRSARFLSPVNNANNTINEDFKRIPNLDDLIIIGRKRIGKIVKLEKDYVAEVKFDSSGTLSLTLFLNLSIFVNINFKMMSLERSLENFMIAHN
ncbi:subfamily C member 14, partial [Brachionus plicatilis]